MKLYRVVPNIFSTGDRINSREILSVEAIYYKMGYASFSGEFGMHKYNNVFEKGEEIKEGKYFFLFLEDAIKQGYYLLTKSHKLPQVGTFYIVEYDFPENIIMKHFGFGDYRDDSGLRNYLMEIYVEKSDFITDNSEILKPKQISKEEKIKALTDMFLGTLNDAQTESEKDSSWYGFYCYQNYQKFEEFVNNPVQISKVIKNILLDMPYKGELIKSEYFTGKMIKINIPFTMGKYGNWQAASEYFTTLGRCDFSREQEQFKAELIESAGIYESEKNSEKVLSLLKSRQYL